MQQPAVKVLLDETGGDDLPAIVVGEKIVARGRYPTRKELAAFAELRAGDSGADLLTREGLGELIAIGAAVAANCEPCLQFHADAGRRAGLTVAQMRMAVKIGAQVKEASTGNMRRLADSLLAQVAAPAASACCSTSAGSAESSASDALECCSNPAAPISHAPVAATSACCGSDPAIPPGPATASSARCGAAAASRSARTGCC
jgi:AhpD family alkylhydroperoxidase